MSVEVLPILYSFRRCPYAMRARLALAVSEQAVEHREIELRNRPPELYEASAKGTVPVLILPDGRVIDESLDVMLWALEGNDPLGWLPRSDEERREMMGVIATNDGEFKHSLDRYKYANRTPDADPLEHRERASLVLRDLDARLSRSTFLFRETASLADMAVAPFVRQFAFADREWFDGEPWPKLRGWLDEFIASPLFVRVMAKHELWKPAE